MHVFVCVCVCVYVCMYVCVCVYVRAYVFMHACMYVCVFYVRMYRSKLILYHSCVGSSEHVSIGPTVYRLFVAAVESGTDPVAFFC
jgi:hypothetical protein